MKNMIDPQPAPLPMADDQGAPGNQAAQPPNQPPVNAQPSVPGQTKSYWRWWHTLSIFIFIVGVGTIGLLIPYDMRLLTWICNIALLLVFTLIVGHGTTGIWRGVLIDDRNKISLSRMQTLAWTILILSAFLTAALTNMLIAMQGRIDTNALSQALRIAVPSDLWILMGISFASLIGSPLIQDRKKQADTKNQPDNSQPANTQPFPNDPTRAVVQGTIVVNNDPHSAQWSNMFMGEEVANEDCLDLGKLQMFYFTILLVFSYGVLIGTQFMNGNTAFHAFPVLDGSVVALLGISHAGYLANKYIPKS